MLVDKRKQIYWEHVKALFEMMLHGRRYSVEPEGLGTRP